MSITKEQVLAMTSFEEIGKAIKSSDPAIAGSMQRLLSDRTVAVHVSKLIQARNQEQSEREAEVDRQTALVNPPTTEELAAEAAAVAAASVEAPVETLVVPPPVERKKIVREYQVRDEDGNPIGRPTHLEAWSEAEMLDKIQDAHVNATRAFHRLKKQKLQFKENEQSRLLTPDEIKAVAAKVVEGKDPVEAEKLVRGILDGEFKKKEKELQDKRDFEEGRRIYNEFIRRHLYEFNPVQSNLNALIEYLKEHSLDFTLDNLEAAFLDLHEQGDKLAPVTAQPRTVEVAANPAPTTAATPAPVAVLPPAAEPVAAQTPTAQPVVNTPPVEATVTTPVAANQPIATRRPGVNGSLPPGSLSAQRTVAVDPAQARKEFMQNLKKMSSVEIKRKRDTDPQFVKQLAAYGIRLQ